MKNKSVTSAHQLLVPALKNAPLSNLPNNQQSGQSSMQSNGKTRQSYEMAVVFGMNTATQQAAVKALLAEKNIRVLYVGDPQHGSTPELVMKELNRKLSRRTPVVFVGHGHNAGGLNNIFGWPTKLGDQINAVAELKTVKGGTWRGHIHQFACYSAKARGKRDDAGSKLESAEQKNLNLQKGQYLLIHGNTVHPTSEDQIKAALGAVAEQLIAHREASLEMPNSTEVLVHTFHATGQTISLSQANKPTVILSPPKSAGSPDGGFADMMQRLTLHPAFSTEAKKAELESVLKKETADKEAVKQFPVRVLFTNIKRGNVKQVQHQIKSNADYLFAKSQGMTPMIAAVAENRPELVQALMAAANGSMDAYVGDEGGSALMMAISNNSLAMTTLLLLEGPAELLSYASEAGETALMLAAMLGDADIVNVLLKKMQPEAIAKLDASGNSALSLAKEAGYDDVVLAIEAALRTAGNSSSTQ
jgi:hypothetical protein